MRESKYSKYSPVGSTQRGRALLVERRKGRFYAITVQKRDRRAKRAENTATGESVRQMNLPLTDHPDDR